MVTVTLWVQSDTRSKAVNMVTLTLWVQSDILVQRRWTWLLWHCEYSLTYLFKGSEYGNCDTMNIVWHTRSKAVNMVTLTLWVQSDILDQRRWTWLLWHCEYSLTCSFKGRLNTTTCPLNPSDLHITSAECTTRPLHHIVPQIPLCFTSTRPSSDVGPFTSLNSVLAAIDIYKIFLW